MSRKLTAKQEAYKNYRIMGKGLKESYCAVYNAKSMSDNSINKAAYELDNHPMIAPYIKSAAKEATERALVTVEDVVKGLLKETSENVAGSTQSGRVSAWKHLGEFTGSFDANRQKLDVKGNIVLSDLSGDELDRRIAELERKTNQQRGKEMNVKELIEILNKIENKELPLCLADWSEEYMPNSVADSVEEINNAEYLTIGEGRQVGSYVLITIK